MNPNSENTPTLFTVWDTPVKVKPAVLVNLAGLWAALSWQAGAAVASPPCGGRPVPGHAAGRRPGPRHHPHRQRALRRRALGGPIFSALALLLGLLLRTLAPRRSLGRELANWSCIGHGFILAASLAPLPIVDGGSILKWTLVEQGQTPDRADEAVRQIDLALGAAATSTGLALVARRRWLPALGLIAGGAIALAAACDRLR